MKAQDVPALWAVSQVASANGNIQTNGNTLHSYALLIGLTTADGAKVLIDYTKAGGHFKSRTTTKHVRLATGHADRVVTVEQAKAEGLITDTGAPGKSVKID